MSQVHKRLIGYAVDCLSNVKNLKKNINVLDVGSVQACF